MKWVLVIIIFLTLPMASSTGEKALEIAKERIIQKEKIVYKEREYAHEYVKNLDNLYKNIINRVEAHFHGYYYTRIPGHEKRSQHYEFKAVDFDFDLVRGHSNVDLYRFIRDSLDFDQLIIYHRGKHMSHVHASYDEGRNRYEIKKCYRWKGKKWYKLLGYGHKLNSDSTGSDM